LIRGEDKKYEIGQMVVTLLSKARDLYKHKKYSFKKLKVVGLDEADFFFKTEGDTD